MRSSWGILIKEEECPVFSDLQHMSLKRLHWERNLTGSTGFGHFLHNEAANCSWWVLVEPWGSWSQGPSRAINKQYLAMTPPCCSLSFWFSLSVFLGLKIRWLWFPLCFFTREFLWAGVLSPLKWFIPWKSLYELVMYACAQVGGWEPKSGSAHSQVIWKIL